jgi:hypothetical protein
MIRGGGAGEVTVKHGAVRALSGFLHQPLNVCKQNVRANVPGKIWTSACQVPVVVLVFSNVTSATPRVTIYFMQ